MFAPKPFDFAKEMVRVTDQRERRLSFVRKREGGAT